MTDPTFTPDEFDRIRKASQQEFRETDVEKEQARLQDGINICLDEANNPSVKTLPASFIGTENGILRAAALILYKRFSIIKNEIRQTGDGTIKVS